MPMSDYGISWEEAQRRNWSLSISFRNLSWYIKVVRQNLRNKEHKVKTGISWEARTWGLKSRSIKIRIWKNEERFWWVWTIAAFFFNIA